MNALLIPYPEIDPVLIELGPFAIRWYALAYIAGLVIGWQIMRRVCEQPPKLLSPVKIDDFLLWAALGVILGGRLGYVLFYKPAHYASHPLEILAVWQGGMSFHGGLLGNASVRQLVEGFLTGGAARVDSASQRQLRSTAQLIAAAATAWRMPELSTACPVAGS